MKIIHYQDPKQKRNDEIVKLAESTDMSYEEIGNRFGLTKAMVSHIAISHGVIRRPEDINKKKWVNKTHPRKN